MDLQNIPHYVLVPDEKKFGYGTLYVLEPSAGFATNSFIILPYNRPEEPVKPRYYAVTSISSISYPEFSGEKPDPIQLTALTSKKKYLETIEKLKQHIQRGDIYEINYCVSFAAKGVTLNPFSIFSRLQRLSRAPYTSLFKNGDDYILCASPELFLKQDHLILTTKPIKGTSRRGATLEEDRQLKHQLHNSIKERTENVMAVDVARNDFSMIADKGTVKVHGLYNIESFETVHQMVSTVQCFMRDNISFEDIIAATFPMASMTGAPKLRARQLADKYEDFERGAYSGAMGFVFADADFELSVIIRSIFYNEKTGDVSIAVGGAITHLCEAEQEYEECLLKAKALLEALNAGLKS